jgi:hypothetical protein
MTIDPCDIVFSCNRQTESKALELAGLAQFRGLVPYVWSQETVGDTSWLEKFEKACDGTTLISLHEDPPDANRVSEVSTSQFKELAMAKAARVFVASRKENASQSKPPKALFGDNAKYCTFDEVWSQIMSWTPKPRKRGFGFGYAIISKSGKKKPGRKVEMVQTAHGGPSKKNVDAASCLDSFARGMQVKYPFNATEAFMACVENKVDNFEVLFPRKSLLTCPSHFVLIYDEAGVHRMNRDWQMRAWDLPRLIKDAGFQGPLFEVCLVRPAAYRQLLDSTSIRAMLEKRFGQNYDTPFKPYRLSSCGTWSELSCRLTQFLENPLTHLPKKPIGAIVGPPKEIPR